MGVGVGVGVGVRVGVGVGVMIGVEVGVAVGVLVGVGVSVGTGVGSPGVGSTNWIRNLIEAVALPDWAVTVAVPLSVKPERVTVAVPP